MNNRFSDINYQDALEYTKAILSKSSSINEIINNIKISQNTNKNIVSNNQKNK